MSRTRADVALTNNETLTRVADDKSTHQAESARVIAQGLANRLLMKKSRAPVAQGRSSAASG